jgi:hypothetical protein
MDTREMMSRSLVCFSALFLLLNLSGCSQDRRDDMGASSKESGFDQEASMKGDVYDDAAFFSVTISPRNPGRNTPLRGHVSGARSIEEWYWYLNDELISGRGGAILSRHDGIRGDRVTLVVLADGQESSDTVIIANTPPEVIGVGLETNQVYRGVDITVFPEAADIDGDPVDFRYIWYINGEEVIGRSAATLPGDVFRKGDTIALQVIPSDRETEGSPFFPESFTIPNGPPRFLSQPPKEFSGFEYRYQIKAEDPDGDPLAFSLERGPEGMTINGTGLLVWPLSAPQDSESTVRVIVSDEDGLWASQEFTISLGMK